MQDMRLERYLRDETLLMHVVEVTPQFANRSSLTDNVCKKCMWESFLASSGASCFNR